MLKENTFSVTTTKIEKKRKLNYLQAFLPTKAFNYNNF